MAESIGKQLMAARQRAGQTIEDVAFKTRVPAARLSELENDDFSNFANLTYAKGFLKLYSGHLGVDISDYLNEFDTRELANIYGHEYVQNAQQTSLTFSQPLGQAPAANGKKLTLLLLGIAALIAIPVLLVTFAGGHTKSEKARARDDSGLPKATGVSEGESSGGSGPKTPATPSAETKDKPPTKPAKREPEPTKPARPVEEPEIASESGAPSAKPDSTDSAGSLEQGTQKDPEEPRTNDEGHPVKPRAVPEDEDGEGSSPDLEIPKALPLRGPLVG